MVMIMIIIWLLYGYDYYMVMVLVMVMIILWLLYGYGCDY